MLEENLQNILNDHSKSFESVANQKQLIIDICSQCKKSINLGGKIILCGNGGSAADSQHLAAELTGKFLRGEQPLPALSLTTDTSAITSIANDFTFDEIFSRQLLALGLKNDTLIAISTSGESKNVINAVKVAKQLNIKTVSLTGKNGGTLSQISDFSFKVNSSNTARIQEIHILVGHIICESMEELRTS
mgnify:FL=1|tara:strand:- start:12376 stop:12945 length:570 start_codon:yes stop_codon:yes gene_type:complete